MSSTLNYHHNCKYSTVAATNLHTLRLKQDEYFGALNHLSLGVAAMLSPLIFTTELTTLQWVLVIINVIVAVPIPSHHAKDEEDSNLPGIIQDLESLLPQ